MEFLYTICVPYCIASQASTTDPLLLRSDACSHCWSTYYITYSVYTEGRTTQDVMLKNLQSWPIFCTPWCGKIRLNYSKKLVFKPLNSFRLVTHTYRAVLHANFFTAHILRIMLLIWRMQHTFRAALDVTWLAHQHPLPPKYLLMHNDKAQIYIFHLMNWSHVYSR